MMFNRNTARLVAQVSAMRLETLHGRGCIRSFLFASSSGSDCRKLASCYTLSDINHQASSTLGNMLWKLLLSL